MSPFSDYQNIINFVGFLFFNIGSGFVVTFFLHSLYITSNATTYGYSGCFLWSIGIFQWVFMIIKSIHHSYAFLVDVSVFYYWFTYEIYILLQVSVHVLLLILFNRILYSIAKQSFAYSDARKLSEHKKVDGLLQVAIKYTILIWYTVFFCMCVLLENHTNMKRFLASIAMVRTVISFSEQFGITFGLSPQEFTFMIWFGSYINCAAMGTCVYLKMAFSRNVYHIICHYPHVCCLKCTRKCVQNKWSDNDANNEMRMAQPSAPAPTATIQEQMSINI